ncbi:MAG: hypothetical protein EHM58_05915 [Ignavibacteriae bacterium]|nr:MAG: hypothetical protein EHM58_05915 [Ignavibacteriota bacterium]
MKTIKIIMNLRYKLLVLFVILTASIFPVNLQSQDQTNARGKGMSNASMVTSFGIDAFGINPANYYYNKYSTIKKPDKKTSVKMKKPQFEISIFSAGASLGSNADFNFYERYSDLISLNRENLVSTFTDVNKLREFTENILPEEKADVGFDVDVKWLSVNAVMPQVGALNFSISDKIALSTFIPGKEQTVPSTYNVILDPLTGRASLTDVELHQEEAQSSWIRKYSLGASKVFESKKGTIRSFTFGFAGALVHGFGDIHAYKSDFSLSTHGISYDENGVHVDSVTGMQNFNTQTSLTDYFKDFAGNPSSTRFTLFPEPAGVGYSIDFGFGMQIGNYVRIAASVTDYGKVKWTKNVFSNFDRGTFAYRNFYLNNNDPTYAQFIDDLKGSGSRNTTDHYWTDMPTKFRAGISYQPSDKFLMEIDWVKGNNNQPGNSTDHIVSLGSEYTPVEFMSLRAGTSIGGPAKIIFGLGVGFKTPVFSIDLAANAINQMIRNSRYSFSVSGKLLF